VWLVLIAFASTGAQAAITGYWALNDGAGGTAVNSAGGTNGTITNFATGGQGAGGSAWVTSDAFFGTVYSGNGDDGAGAYISAGTIPQATLNSNFTWSFWYANTGTNTGGNDVVLGNRFGGPGWTKFTPTNFEWRPSPDGGGSTGNVNSTDMPGDGTWRHYSIVKNGSSFQAYVDGVAAGSGNFTGTFNGAIPFFIGGDSGGERPAGRFAHVATFDEALSQTQVQTIRNNDFSAFGLGQEAEIFYPVATTQKTTGTLPVAANDLIAGQAAVVTGTPLNGLESTSNNPLVLTNGVFGAANKDGAPGEVVTIQTGTTLTYLLDLASAPAGYDITGIDTYAGWNDTGRDAQDYTVQVAYYDDLNTFVGLADVGFNPGGGDPSNTFVSLENPLGGPMAFNVGAIRFLFGAQENGHVGFREIDVFGTASVPEPASIAIWSLVGLSLAGFGYCRWRRAK
jgi:hypothetical protein